MSSLTRPMVDAAIQAYVDPYLDQDLIAAKCLRDVRIDGGSVEIGRAHV